jgi:hypothetical protein
VGCVPRSAPRTTRALLLLVATALTFGRRSKINAGVRMHVQRLQRITPIQQFAPAAGNRALLDRGHGPFLIRIVAQRDLLTGRLLLVPIDERVLAGWLG